mmetsp:Transcript_25451/g.29130  ORF Transcript_25451/g.29130 Transcript_25451/m.29130 type:complete len:188 (-) Transcript_25451:924-1487(-)
MAFSFSKYAIPVLAFVGMSVLIAQLVFSFQKNSTIAETQNYIRSSATSSINEDTLIVDDSQQAETFLPQITQPSQVELDPSGNYKFILIEVVDQANKKNVEYFVVGTKKFGYHKHILRDWKKKNHEYLENKEASCPGGGWMRAFFSESKIEIYSRSLTYGKSDHEFVKQIVKKSYPDFKISIEEDEF